MSKVTECPICLERYDNKEKTPKILSCGHTFCKKCLSSLQIQSSSYKCSICRKNQSLDDIDNLSTNLLIYDLLYNPEQDENIFIDDKNIFKIILIGSACTGKTSLIQRFIKKEYSKNYDVTIGVDIKNAQIKIDENNYIGLNIWDTAGSEKFQTLTMNYLRNCYGAFLVFDISRRETFEEIPKWIQIFMQQQDKDINEVIYLIGNKSDCENLRNVSREEAEEFAKKNNMKYFETSAKDGKNVDKIFNEIGKDIFLCNKEGNKYAKNMELNGIKKLRADLVDEDDTNDFDCWKSLFDAFTSFRNFFGCGIERD